MKLRPYRQETDFKFIKEWISDERTHALWCANLIPYPLTSEHMEAILRKDEMEYGGHPFTAADDNDRPVGFFTLSVNQNEQDAFLKFVIIDQSLRGKGYGTKMLKLILDYAFQNVDVTSVRLNVFDVNTAARKCYSKAGFTEQRLQPDTFRFQEELWGRCSMTAQKTEGNGY
ncbi:MAG: GNAT family protein [Lachnospiraceae bacterium]|nr:GNAT family protein [Lachnospiraceae bacterium]